MLLFALLASAAAAAASPPPADCAFQAANGHWQGSCGPLFDETPTFSTPAQELPPSELDRTIIARAAAILSSDTVWNRADNRQCPPAATTRSIYCAMARATAEVTGAFHHRRPALELVRRIVDERTAGRAYEHRLMDYNNDPATRLADVRSLFAQALARIPK